jgi:hypothetical protein
MSDYHLLGDLLLQRIAGPAAVVLLALTSDYHHLGASSSKGLLAMQLCPTSSYQ